MFERYFKDHITKLAFMLMASIFFAAATPRHSLERKIWGFPLKYQFRVREEYLFPGGEVSDFNVIILVLNVLILFVSLICIWYAYRFLWQKINYFTSGLG